LHLDSLVVTIDGPFALSPSPLMRIHPYYTSSMDSPTFRPSPLSRSSTNSSKKSLTLDLSNLPPLDKPTPPSNTLLFTNLQNVDIFRPDNLQTIRELVAKTAPIHSWAPLKSFRRIIVSFFDEDAAVAVRAVWDGEAVLGERCNVYFGRPTPLDAPADSRLALPDAGKLFFISPPPSPPRGWEMRLEGAPNKQVHAEDLADALAKLHQRAAPETPVSPDSPSGPGTFRGTRSRSSTLIYQPEDHGSSSDLPAIAVEDTSEGEEEMSVADKKMLTHTARPPVELMQVDN
jgi:hypothetical protein